MSTTLNVLDSNTAEHKAVTLGDYGEVETIDVDHQGLQDGRAYSCCAISLTVANGATFAVAGDPTASPYSTGHLSYEVATGGDAVLSLREGITYSGGTPCVPWNMKRTVATPSVVSLVADPTITASGTLLCYKLIPGGTVASMGGGVKGGLIVDTTKKYALMVYNISGNTEPIGITVTWIAPNE